MPLILFFSMLLAACDNNEQYKNLQSYIDHLKQSVIKNNKSDSSMNIPFPEPSTYRGDALRPPFEDSQLFSAKSSVQLNPLLTYPLIMLRLLGTVTQDNASIAFILAPDNKMYQVKIGDLIGDHKGKIVNIRTNRVDVMEHDTENGKPGSQRIDTLKLKEEH